jgi:hypothetical protein
MVCGAISVGASLVRSVAYPDLLLNALSLHSRPRKEAVYSDSQDGTSCWLGLVRTVAYPTNRALSPGWTWFFRLG